MQNRRPRSDVSTGVYVGLGSNLAFENAEPSTLLKRAMERLEEGGDKIIATSSLWVSDAWPAGAGAPKFINAVCRVKPHCNDTSRLMRRLHDIEAEFGRLRDQHNQWSPRTLDLDLLDYNGFVTKKCSFPTLPHPKMAERDFVLLPLMELSLNWVHPITQKSAQNLLEKLKTSGLTNNCIQFLG